MCNGCTKRGYCRLEKHFYDAKKTHLAYCDTLVQSRNGFDLTLYDITRINSIVTPRIKKGQSLYHIAKNNESELNISESTLRRLVMAGEMDSGIIDLPQAVKRRKRKVRTAPKLKTVAFNLKDTLSGLFAIPFFAKSNKIKPNLIKFSLILLI